MYMVHSHILQHKDYYKVHSFICVLFYNKNKWVRAENNSETKKCTKSCDEISIAIPQIVDGKKNQVNFTDSGSIQPVREKSLLLFRSFDGIYLYAKMQIPKVFPCFQF